MIEIHLLRHVNVNGPAALYGHTDVAPQLEQNKHLLAALIQSQQSTSYDLVISSPLQRCRLLAEQFSKKCQIPLVCLNDFKEMNFGDFDGIAFDDINFEGINFDGYSLDNSSQSNNQNWLLLEKFWQAPNKITLPNGEALAQFHHRVTTAWLKLIKEQFSDLSKEKKPLKILLIAHGGVIRMILAHALQLDWQSATWQQHLQIANASCSKVTISRPFSDKNKTHSVVNYIGSSMLNTL